MTEHHSLERVISGALDDVSHPLPAHTRAQFVDRVAELLELDREQRHQARRDWAYRGLRVEEAHDRIRPTRRATPRAPQPFVVQKPIPPPPPPPPPPPRPTKFKGQIVRGEPLPRWIFRWTDPTGQPVIDDLFGERGRENAVRHAKKVANKFKVMATVEPIFPPLGEPS